MTEFSEFGLISEITKDLVFPPEVLLGPGDDAAVFQLSGTAVWSVDTAVEGVHFRRNWSRATDIGRKAVASALADLEAMGAKGLGILVSLSLPASLEKDWVLELAQGIISETRKAKVALLGGDLTKAEEIVISVSVLGELGEVGAVTRAGAQIDDVIAISSPTGLAAAGLALLNRGFRSPREVVQAQRCPEISYGLGQKVAAQAHAMIDISDGLLADLEHIAEASGVAIHVDSKALIIPEILVAVATVLRRSTALDFVLTGGEDHVLAGSFAADDVPEGWQIIGAVRSGRGIYLDGEKYQGKTGFQHF